MKRVLTALALIPCVLCLVLLTSPVVFGAVIAALAAAGLREFYTIAERCGIHALAVPGYGASLLLVLFPQLDKSLFLTLFTLALLAAGFREHRGLGKSLPSAAVTLTGVLYVAAPLLWGRLVHRIDPHWLLFVLVVNAVGDIAALYTGKSLGKHPLALHVSPHKTWEGTIGSIVFSTIAGTVYANVFLAGGPIPAEAAVLALVLNIAGQLGDLTESALKRGAGVKDSGKLLPGHGGILDRIDAFLFSAPVMYAYLHYF